MLLNSSLGALLFCFSTIWIVDNNSTSKSGTKCLTRYQFHLSKKGGWWSCSWVRADCAPEPDFQGKTETRLVRHESVPRECDKSCAAQQSILPSMQTTCWKIDRAVSLDCAISYRHCTATEEPIRYWEAITGISKGDRPPRYLMTPSNVPGLKNIPLPMSDKKRSPSTSRSTAISNTSNSSFKRGRKADV